ncbi:uncharacterized protein LOC142591287 isoform X1 [Dermacentor variabilis]|uniref:uncharacterized protein LOC142591287 isoform X1 n=1 Tax=Dermacentor variabilis TaxID=34621 RepID=UPI003F5C87F0
MSADVAGRDMLGTRTSRICDFYLRVCIFITMLQGASPSPKVPEGERYRKEVADKVLQSLFPARRSVPLPDHYFAARDPFNTSATQYRFNLTRGRLYMVGTWAHRWNYQICKFQRTPTPSAYCILPITGSFATYNCKLSYGRPVVQTFKITTSIMPHSGGWSNPADVSGYFATSSSGGNTLMALTGVYVTEFMVVTNSTPPFQSFQVFQGNKNLTEKIWRNFTEYVFRKCKQDMRKKMKWLYHKRFLAAARAVGALAMPLLWR